MKNSILGSKERKIQTKYARKYMIEVDSDIESSEEEFEMNPEQFVDLCILLGCDYVDKIKGIGPKKAIELVRKGLNPYRWFDYKTCPSE